MIRRLSRLPRDERAAALVEFALVLPIMISLFLGTFEVTRVVAADMRLASAAQSYADMIAQQSTLTVAQMTNFCNGGKLAMTPLPAKGLKAAVASVTHGNSSTAEDWHDESCGTAKAIASATTIAAPLVPNVNDSVIIVQASYAYTSPISYVLKKSYTLTQSAYARPRNVTTVGAP